MPQLTFLFGCSQLLPADAASELPTEIEDAEMTDFDPSKHSTAGSRGASGSSAYEEDEEGGGGNPRVQCAQQ